MMMKSLMSYQNHRFLIMFYLIMILNFSCFFIYVSCFSSNASFPTSSATQTQCLPDQGTALLQFRQEFAFQKPDFNYYYYRCSVYGNRFYDDFHEYYPKMKSWNVADKDCCSWDGVTCNTKTGQVVGLDLANSWLQGPLSSSSSLFKLHQLQKINLAFNNFSFFPFPSEFGRLSRLTHLNLSFSMFSGNIPSEISCLTNLVSLDLSSFEGYDATSLLYLKDVDFINLTKNMTSLRQLHLHQVNISSSIPQSLANLSSLTSLALGGCGLHGEFPEKIFQFPKLQYVHLSCNYFLTGFLPQFQPSSTSLRFLFLDVTKFSGKLPDSIGYLKSLNVLALQQCDFVGPIPSSIWNLSNLIYLDLSWNNFNGNELPSTILGNLAKLTILELYSSQLSGEIPSSLGNLTSLQYLSLSNNSFRGQIPSSLGNLKQMKFLMLSHNNLNGFIPPLFSLPALNGLWLDFNQFIGPLCIQNISSSSSQLEHLYLRSNQLSGKVPWSMFKLTNLIYLSLDYNNFSGTIELGNFSNLCKLKFLSLSLSGLTITALSINSELPKFQDLLLSSCNIIEFPKFLKTQDQLESLDLSYNRIEGQIPEWLWVSIEKMKLMSYLDLSQNNLQGSLTVPPLFISYFYISENNLTGRINPSFRNWTNLKVLDMSRNRFDGTIPQWLGNFGSSLEVLNLQGNNFHGSLPQMFTHESMNNLLTLDLSNNKLQGKVPKSLINCSKLEVLNLGHNQISDTFPFWLQTLPNLQVLVLGGNKFFMVQYGILISFRVLSTCVSLIYLSIISVEVYHQNTLEIGVAWKMQISHLRYMGYWSNYYTEHYSMMVMNKGLEMQLVKTLTILPSIDLSNNRFHEEIPSSIGNLRSLIVLNLSSNSFTGAIPSSLGNLSELELFFFLV